MIEKATKTKTIAAVVAGGEKLCVDIEGRKPRVERVNGTLHRRYRVNVLGACDSQLKMMR
jgi:hypothetical protein